MCFIYNIAHNKPTVPLHCNFLFLCVLVMKIDVLVGCVRCTSGPLDKYNFQ